MVSHSVKTDFTYCGSHGTIDFFKLGRLVRTTINFSGQPEM